MLNCPYVQGSKTFLNSKRHHGNAYQKHWSCNNKYRWPQTASNIPPKYQKFKNINPNDRHSPQYKLKTTVLRCFQIIIKRSSVTIGVEVPPLEKAHQGKNTPSIDGRFFVYLRSTTIYVALCLKISSYLGTIAIVRCFQEIIADAESYQVNTIRL